MAWGFFVLFVGVLSRSAVSVRINFTSCQHPEWHCENNVSSEIVYSCSLVKSNVSTFSVFKTQIKINDF